jgi:membrane fusion protein, hemolysin D
MLLLPQRSPKAISPSGTQDDLTLPVILEFQSPTSAVLAAPVPRSARSIAWFITSMLAAILIATGFIPVDRVVTMEGKVVSTDPTQVVMPLDIGIVRSINVSEGDKVRKGQLLARLDPTLAVSTEDALKAQVSTYSAQVARMQAEVSHQPFSYTGLDRDMALQAAIYAQRRSQYEYTLENYKQQIDGLVSLIARSESDAVGYRERLLVAQNLEGMRKELQRLQVGSRLNTLAAQDNRAEMARNLANAEQTADNAKSNLAAEVATRDAFIHQWDADISQQLSDATGKLSDARESLRKAEVHSNLVELRADRDGTVLSVAKVSVGSVMQAGQQFFTLMPADAPLAVQGIIEGSEGGFVHLGDPVTIKFDTFQYSHYGMAYGSVQSVSADTFYGNDPTASQASAVPLPGPSMSTGTTGAYYTSQISIDRVALRDVPPNFHLTPGLTVTADIKVGRRTVLAYFMSRIIPLATEALREPGN